MRVKLNLFSPSFLVTFSPRLCSERLENFLLLGEIVILCSCSLVSLPCKIFCQVRESVTFQTWGGERELMTCQMSFAKSQHSINRVSTIGTSYYQTLLTHSRLLLGTVSTRVVFISTCSFWSVSDSSLRLGVHLLGGALGKQTCPKTIERPTATSSLASYPTTCSVSTYEG
jgi:hypothetical protein